jgi:hypothetical protein
MWALQEDSPYQERPRALLLQMASRYGKKAALTLGKFTDF